MKPVLHSRTVSDVLTRDAVGVHLDFDRNKAAAQKYGVRGIPADVLLTPDGRVLGQMSGLKQPHDYARRVRAVAGQYVSLKVRPRPARPLNPSGPDPGPRLATDMPKQTPRDPLIARRQDPSFPGLAAPEPSESTGPRVPDATPNAGPVPDAAFGGSFGDSATSGDGSFGNSSFGDGAADSADSPSSIYGDNPDPFGPRPGADPPVDDFAPRRGSDDPPSVDPPADRNTRRPTYGTPRVARRATRKLLGMRGFCPVTLHESQRWVRGNPDLQWEHQGITYFLSDEKAFDKFWERAEDYAPKLLGCDPVLYRDDARAVPGSIRHAALWRGDLFLFSLRRESRAKFHADPSRYANNRQVLAARRSSKPWAGSEPTRRPTADPPTSASPTPVASPASAASPGGGAGVRGAEALAGSGRRTGSGGSPGRAARRRRTRPSRPW